MTKVKIDGERSVSVSKAGEENKKVYAGSDYSLCKGSDAEAKQIYGSTRLKFLMAHDDASESPFLYQIARQKYSRLLPDSPARFEYMVGHYVKDKNNLTPQGIHRRI